ncbi:MFS transporter [Amycolatopsis sp. H20-H5]|uniref:MFS transporter n=1 Tax=Amycolatopsis sp. H20-H5 TaxID=3046309 RepID=UPI002DBABFC5|nr:MFS transporter [Amycolatopsis sp. H20-H5]MEC3978900.1 MFS transporter [Amycolatopsis sp. H20-H5]
MTQVATVGFTRPLKIREFRALWSAELVSLVGDQVARVALSLVVFNQTSSAALTALTYALTFIPTVLGGFLLSGLADRFPRRAVLVVNDLLRAALAALMAVPGLPLPALWIFVALLSVAAGPFKAAQMSLLPQVLHGEALYGAGLALRQASTPAAQLVGFACGGALLAVVDPHLGMLLNAGTFLVSAALVLGGVRPRAAARSTTTTEDDRGAHHGVDLPRGKANLASLYALVCLIGLYMVPEGLAAPYSNQLGGAAFGVGLLLAADPAGGAIGAWLTTRVRIPTSPLSASILAAAAGLALVGCGVGPGLPLSVALWATSGALMAAYLIKTQQLVVAAVPDRNRGRVMGRMGTCLYCSQGLSVLVGGVVAQAIGSFHAVASAGLLAALLALGIGIFSKIARSRSDTGSERDIVPESITTPYPSQQTPPPSTRTARTIRRPVLARHGRPTGHPRTQVQPV